MEPQQFADRLADKIIKSWFEAERESGDPLGFAAARQLFEERPQLSRKALS